jgi:hypothetical protein
MLDLEALYVPEPNTGCWLWLGCVRPDGYGVRGVSKTRQVRAHRFVYELARGPIPRGLDLDHLCRVRSCVNPAHLEPVTRGENLRRGVGLSVQHSRKTACPLGHPYDDVWYESSPGRRCLKCNRRRALESYYRRKTVRESASQPA